jgi:hypothetical protein
MPQRTKACTKKIFITANQIHYYGKNKRQLLRQKNQ